MNPIEQAIKDHEARLQVIEARFHKKSRSVFTPPTIEEIDAYCIEKGISVRPEYIWNHYESKGWKVGKTLMKNWRSAVSQANFWEGAPRRKLPARINPEAEAAALEKRKQEIRDNEKQYYRERTTERLEAILADPHATIARYWLIREVLEERRENDN